MKAARKKFLGPGSWKDLDKLGLYLLVCGTYVIGLVAFFKSTGQRTV
jgi:hypothetical protein